MKLLQYLNSKIKILYFLLSFILVSQDFAVEAQKNLSSPSFSIYADKIPVYATLSGNFTFYPQKEIHKVETFLKNKKQKVEHNAYNSSYLSIKYDNKVFKFRG